MYVGIDIGGTKTHLALEASGSVEHRVVATSAWQRDGLFGDGNVDRLLDLVRADVADPGDTPLAIGAHGCDSPAQVDRFDALVRGSWPGPVRVLNDAELLAPAFGLKEAICLIVGTGSIVIGRTADADPVYVGGHGWLLDDYGSAPGITREAVRAVLEATDAGRPRDGLAEALMSHFGVAQEVDLSLRFTTSAAIDVWAEPARLVFECADAGSETALGVIEDAADRLARDLALARARGALGTTVVAAGGVVTHQPRLLEAISRHLAVHDPELTVELLTVAPVFGALKIARDLHQTPYGTVTDTHGGTR
jgi:N-acetylglucosamine kinase-like BadF-type ATPase